VLREVLRKCCTPPTTTGAPHDHRGSQGLSSPSRNYFREVRMTSVPTTVPPGTGWRSWGDSNPYRFQMVEAWSGGWMEPEVLRPREMHPATNVAGLFWRPVQAARHEPEVANRSAA
jgi:hypothetical protein